MIKKMLFVSNMYPSNENPSYGAFIKNIESSLRNIEQIHVDTEVIVWEKRNKIKKLFKYLSYWCRCFFKVIITNYDMIYINYITLSIVPFLLLPGVTKNAVIFAHVHGSDLIYHKNRNFILRNSLRFLLKKAITKATFFISPSNYYKSVLVNEFKIKEEKIIVYPSGGVNREVFYRSNRNYKNNNTLGYVGRLENEKGILELLEAVKSIKEKLPQVNWCIIGAGSLKEKVIEFLKNNNLNNTVKLFDPVAQDKLNEFYGNFDCLVFPTYRESLGLVAVEAMSCGVPVLGSDIPALREYISHKNNGYLFEAKSSSAITDAVSWYYELNEAEKQNISINAYISTEKYDSKLVNKNFLERIKSKIIF